jgi:signal peptidase I
VTRRRWLLVVLVPVAAAVLVGVVVHVRYDAYTLPPTHVMGSTLQPGDHFLVEDVDGGDLDRGEVIIHDDQGTEVVTRVVGLPGEELLATDDGRLVVDGHVLDEPYLADGTVTRFFEAHEPPVAIGEDELFVMGDTREDSLDSRTFGPIPFDAVVGRVAVIWWPLDRAGGV